ncbi:MAG: protein kinase [Myxococcota bacterium]|jgi:serine/threonine-protein kinase|nr:protein kinase [Myxococcota bacterium]
MKPQTLEQGTVVGDRFEIEALAASSDFGWLYKAMDKERRLTVGLRVLPAELVLGKEDETRIKDQIRLVSTLSHRNLQSVFGLGTVDAGGLFVATEWVEGSSLRAVLERRAKSGKHFSFKGAYNIIGHVCNALAVAHPKVVHGALSPRCIIVSTAGRVKVGDFAIPMQRLAAGGQEHSASESVYWAPEVTRGDKKLDQRADIYSLGALFYELISGVVPQRPLRAPSKLGFSKDVDAFLGRCMASDPDGRFPDTASVKKALLELVAAHAAEDAKAKADDDNIGIDVEIVISESIPPAPLKRPPVAQANAAQPSNVQVAAPPQQPAIKAPLPGPPLPPPPSRAASTESDRRFSNIDMGAVLGELGKSEEARWMVQKDKFDHGPFTNRELLEMILLGQVEGKHQALDMKTGVRKKIRQWGHFDAYLEEFRLKKKKREEAVALERTEKAETRGTAFKVLLALGIAAVLGIGGSLFWLSRQARKDSINAPEDVLAALESGEIKLRTGAGDGKALKKRKGGGRRGGNGGGEFVPGMSYEEAMNMGVDLGDAKSGGGQAQLTAGVIASIMDQNVRKFLPCMAGQSVKRVDLEIAIGGDGRVVGVSVRQGDGALQSCVSSKVRSIKFPGSSAPRTAATWYFELY